MLVSILIFHFQDSNQAVTHLFWTRILASVSEDALAENHLLKEQQKDMNARRQYPFAVVPTDPDVFYASRTETNCDEILRMSGHILLWCEVKQFAPVGQSQTHFWSRTDTVPLYH